MSTLEQEGEEVVGQARCPFESRQSNVGLFAGERCDPADVKTTRVFIAPFFLKLPVYIQSGFTSRLIFSPGGTYLSICPLTKQGFWPSAN